jgi:two-component system chemotaxis response regulator CheY
MAVSSAARGATIVNVDDAQSLAGALQAGVDLLLVNRQLDWGFDTTDGVELVKQLRASHAQVKLMLVSNFPEAQQAAVAAGALPGFGKREIGTKRVTEVLHNALPE